MRVFTFSDELERVLPFLRRQEAELARAFLDKEPDLVRSQGGVLLAQALDSECYPIARFLLVEKGIRAHDPALNQALTPLAQGDLSAVLAAIESDPALLKPARFGGKSLLELAMILDDLPLVRALTIDKGIRLKRGYGNFRYFSRPVQPEIAVLMFSCYLGFLDISQFFFDHSVAFLKEDEKERVLAQAMKWICGSDHAHYVEWMVSVGADVNFDDGGSTALVKAASVGADTAIMALLRSGAYVNQITRGRGGNADALWNAVWNRHPATVRLLLKNGAHPLNASVRQSKTWPESPYGNALNVAKMLEHEEIIEMLTRFLAENPTA